MSVQPKMFTAGSLEELAFTPRVSVNRTPTPSRMPFAARVLKSARVICEIAWRGKRWAQPCNQTSNLSISSFLFACGRSTRPTSALEWTFSKPAADASARSFLRWLSSMSTLRVRSNVRRLSRPIHSKHSKMGCVLSAA